MEEVRLSETLIIVSTQGIKSEDLKLHQYCCDNLKACKEFHSYVIIKG